MIKAKNHTNKMKQTYETNGKQYHYVTL